MIANSERYIGRSILEDHTIVLYFVSLVNFNMVPEMLNTVIPVALNCNLDASTRVARNLSATVCSLH